MTEGGLKGILVYFVTKGPVWACDIEGTFLFQVEAQVSADNGKTVRPMVFTFATEEHALEFKQDVNSRMEPLVIGEEE